MESPNPFNFQIVFIFWIVFLSHVERTQSDQAEGISDVGRQGRESYDNTTSLEDETSLGMKDATWLVQIWHMMTYIDFDFSEVKATQFNSECCLLQS